MIFTDSGGKTVIELWRNGNVVDGVDQVVEVGETTTSSSISSTNLVSFDFDVTTTTTEKNENGDDIELSERESTSTVLIDKLRTSVRSGDKSIHFRVDEDESNGQRSRRPKSDSRGDNTLSAIRDLREETERSNKNFLMSVFSRVNGGKRKRRNTNNYFVTRSVAPINR